MAVQAPPLSDFPPRDEIARLWGFNDLEASHHPVGHGAQLVLAAADGEWMLKRCRVDSLDRERLDATLSALDGLRPQLHGGLIPALRSLRGGGFVHQEHDRLYYIMRRVCGRRPSYWRGRDVAAVLGALGRFHRQSAKAGAALARKLTLPPQDVETVWRAQTDWFSDLSRRVEQASVDTLARRLFLGRHARFAEQAARADAFFGDRLREIDARIPPVLAHGDSHENNYLLARRAGEPDWLLDLESSAPKPAACDLIVPLAEFGLRRGWPVGRIEEMLADYERLYPLAPAERALLGAMLIFPRQWTRSLMSLLRRPKFDLGAARGLARCIVQARKKERLIAHIETAWR